MSDCLRALEQVIVQINQSVQKPEKAIEPEIVEG